MHDPDDRSTSLKRMVKRVLSNRFNDAAAMKLVQLFEKEQTFMVTEKRVYRQRESGELPSLNENSTATTTETSIGVTRSERNIKHSLHCRKET